MSGQQVCAMIGGVSELIGGATTAATIITTVVIVFFAITGLLKAMWRFGIGVAWRKVFIVADADARDELQGDLMRSGIVRKRNIKTMTRGQISNLKGARLIILDYGYLEEDETVRIVSQKDSDCGVLVYAKPGTIPGEVMEKLNLSQHVSVVNFRGRLVNEVLILLLSTSFSRKDIKYQNC